MKLKVLDILTINKGLTSVAKKELPAKIAFRFARLQINLELVLKQADAQRINLIKKYGSANEKETVVSVENMPKFEQEYVQVLNEEIEVDFSKLNIEDFENLQFNTEDLKNISLLFN